MQCFCDGIQGLYIRVGNTITIVANYIWYKSLHIILRTGNIFLPKVLPSTRLYTDQHVQCIYWHAVWLLRSILLFCSDDAWLLMLQGWCPARWNIRSKTVTSGSWNRNCQSHIEHFNNISLFPAEYCKISASAYMQFWNSINALCPHICRPIQYSNGRLHAVDE